MPVGDVSEAPLPVENAEDTRLADASAAFVAETPTPPTSEEPPSPPVQPESRDMNPLSLLQEGIQWVKVKIDQGVVAITPPDDHKPINESLVAWQETPAYDPYGLPLPQRFVAKDTQNPASVEAATHANAQMARVEIGAFTGALGAVVKVVPELVSGVTALAKGVTDTVGIVLDIETNNIPAAQKKLDGFNAMVKAGGDLISNPLKPVDDFLTRQSQLMKEGKFSTAGINGGAALANTTMAVMGGVEAAVGLPKLIKSMGKNADDIAALTKAADEAGIPREGAAPPSPSAAPDSPSGTAAADVPKKPRLMDPDLDGGVLDYDPEAVARLNLSFHETMVRDLQVIKSINSRLSQIVYQLDLPNNPLSLDVTSFEALTPGNITSVVAEAERQSSKIKAYTYKIPANILDKTENGLDFYQIAENLKEALEKSRKEIARINKHKNRGS
jgi:hypothetical protein